VEKVLTEFLDIDDLEIIRYGYVDNFGSSAKAARLLSLGLLRLNDHSPVPGPFVKIRLSATKEGADAWTWLMYGGQKMIIQEFRRYELKLQGAPIIS